MFSAPQRSGEYRLNKRGQTNDSRLKTVTRRIGFVHSIGHAGPIPIHRETMNILDIDPNSAPDPKQREALAALQAELKRQDMTIMVGVVGEEKAPIQELLSQKIDWAMLDRETQGQVEIMVNVCAELWEQNPAMARKLERSIVALWGESICGYED